MSQQERFEDVAGYANPGFFTELWQFMAENKKWWLLPIVVMLVALGVLTYLSSTAVAPFIYTLF
jgi:hypothetical protein